MEVLKAGSAAAGGVPDAADMERIRALARGEIAPEQVYTFPVILCDNEVDRDYERFGEETLRELAALFVGKTGISDHEWRAEKQVARIYKTELVRDDTRRTAAGDAYVGLKAWAYMLRSEANQPLIDDIEAGIKKEVSVGCSVRESRCSICGAPIGGEGCGHVKGETYGARLCFAELCGAADAFEWSFVAVPAQPGAGVTKAMDRARRERSPEYAALRKEAALGRRYLAALRGEVKKLSLVCGREVYDAVAPGLERMDAEGLLGLKAAFEKRAAEILPLNTQLPHGGENTRFDGDEYRV